MKINFSKTVIIAGLVSLMFSAATFAQGGPGHGKRHGKPGVEHHLDRLQRALDLNDEQYMELLVILQSAEEERRAIFEQALEQARPEICAQRDATHAAVLEVLTDEQAEEFEELKAERMERFEEGGRRGGMPDLSCD